MSIPGDFHAQPYHRLQMEPEDKVHGKLWIGSDESPKVQCVWESAETVRVYTNKLLDVFGDLTYDQLLRIENASKALRVG